WPLLDVELEIGGESADVALRLCRVARLADRAQRVRDAHPVLVGALRRAVGQPAERRARAEETDPEPRTLFITPADDLHRTLVPFPPIAESSPMRRSSRARSTLIGPRAGGRCRGRPRPRPPWPSRDPRPAGARARGSARAARRSAPRATRPAARRGGPRSRRSARRANAARSPGRAARRPGAGARARRARGV